MDSAAREARLTARKRDIVESRCPVALLPPEMKHQIMTHISSQQSLSRLGQSCRAWYETATQELYTRDAKEHTSTLEISRRWGGQIDAIQRGLSQWVIDQMWNDNSYKASTALHFAVVIRKVRLTKTLLDMKASLTIPCSTLLWRTIVSEELLQKVSYFQRVFKGYFCHFGPVFAIFLAFLQNHADMYKLLVEHGAGREDMIIDSDTDPKVMSILLRGCRPDHGFSPVAMSF
ncbi:hypothetical protein E4U61_004267 [Claviceps capensis]|nr:hypothetical protein E4U61_004267 [Claviceps capensis]